MTPEFFSRYMLSKIAQALGTNEHITHDALDTLWLGFGDNTELSDATKAKKANEMVEKIAKKPNADPALIQIINEVFHHDQRAEARKEHAAFKQIEKQLLKEGFVSDEDGLNPPAPGGSAQPKSPDPVFPEMKPKAKDLWSDPKKPWNDMPPSAKTHTAQTRDPRKVFIVHGRDMKTKNTLEQFLRYIEVSPIDWAEARRLTNLSSPSTLEVVQSGLSHAQAVIVIFTPDDEARLKDEYHQQYDGLDEVNVTGQARQNVILEAGMAMGIDAKRTVFVRKGNTRAISDIDGMQWINLNNDWNDRKMLVDSLLTAGVSLNTHRNFTDTNAGIYS